MTTSDFIQWIRPCLLKIKKRDRPYFLELSTLGKNIFIKGRCQSHHIESSLDTIKQANLLKCIHVFRYFADKDGLLAGDIIDTKRLLEFVRRINRGFNTYFNLAVLKGFFSLPLYQGSQNDIVVFYGEYDRQPGLFSKLSFHINPAQGEWLCDIMDFLQRKNRRLLKAGFLKSGAQFMGVDLFRSGDFQIKIYQRLDFLPRDLNIAYKKALLRVDALRPWKNSLLMYRFAHDGSLLSGPALYLHYSGGPGSGQLADVKGTKKLRDLILVLEEAVDPCKLIWLAVKGKVWEVYFR